MPDDSALLLAHMLLRCLYTKILVHTRQLLHAGIEEQEIVHKFNESLLFADFEEVLVQFEPAIVRFVFLPIEKILLRCADCAVLQTFGVIASENDLHS